MASNGQLCPVRGYQSGSNKFVVLSCSILYYFPCAALWVLSSMDVLPSEIESNYKIDLFV